MVDDGAPWSLRLGCSVAPPGAITLLNYSKENTVGRSGFHVRSSPSGRRRGQSDSTARRVTRSALRSFPSQSDNGVTHPTPAREKSDVSVRWVTTVQVATEGVCCYRIGGGRSVSFCVDDVHETLAPRVQCHNPSGPQFLDPSCIGRFAMYLYPSSSIQRLLWVFGP